MPHDRRCDRYIKRKALTCRHLPFTICHRLALSFRNLPSPRRALYASPAVITKTPVTELRTAVRFPLHLPVSVRSANTEHVGETADISAAGALLALEADFAPGSPIEFSLMLPPDALGNLDPVQVCCTGRVVRTIVEDGRRCTAAIIDEYRFEKM